MSDRLLPSGQWLKDRLSTCWVGKSEIIYEEEVPSTNTLLKELARQGAPAGTVAVCDFQSAGRGRLQRVWKAAAGETLPVSLLLKPRLTPEQIPLCTLGAAVAASQAIEQVCPGLKAGIKWPNDVVISGRKCVGILCEGAFDPEGRLCVIMGVGFNGNQREFPPELSASATSLFLEKQRCDPAAAPVVLRELLAAFLEAVERVDSEMVRIRDAGKVRTRERIAVLAALNMAFEIADRDAATAASGIDSERLHTLVQRLDEVLDTPAA